MHCQQDLGVLFAVTKKCICFAHEKTTESRSLLFTDVSPLISNMTLMMELLRKKIENRMLHSPNLTLSHILLYAGLTCTVAVGFRVVDRSS